MLDIKKQLDPAWIAYKRGQGLFPKSGDWYYPDRWINADDFIEEWESVGYGDWAEQFVDNYGGLDNIEPSYKLGKDYIPTLLDLLDKAKKIEEYRKPNFKYLYSKEYQKELGDAVQLYQQEFERYGISEINEIYEMLEEVRFREVRGLLDKHNIPQDIGRNINEVFIGKFSEYTLHLINAHYAKDNMLGFLNDLTKISEELGVESNNLETNIKLLTHWDFFNNMGLISPEDLDTDFSYNTAMEFEQYITDFEELYKELRDVLPDRINGIVQQNISNFFKLLRQYSIGAKAYAEGDDEHSDKLADSWTINEMMENYEDISEYIKDINRFKDDFSEDSPVTLFHLKAMMQYQKGSSTINRFSYMSQDEIYNENNDGIFLVETIRALDSAIEFAGIQSSDDTLTYYRGVPSNLFKFAYDSFISGNKKYTNPSFMSISEEIMTAASFGKVIEIRIPPNTISSLNINEIMKGGSQFSNERETILPRNTQFSVDFDERKERLILTAIGINESDVGKLTSGIEVGENIYDEYKDVIDNNLDYIIDNEEDGRKKSAIIEAKNKIKNFIPSFKKIINKLKSYNDSLYSIANNPYSIVDSKVYIEEAHREISKVKLQLANQYGENYNMSYEDRQVVADNVKLMEDNLQKVYQSGIKESKSLLTSTENSAWDWILDRKYKVAGIDGIKEDYEKFVRTKGEDNPVIKIVKDIVIIALNGKYHEAPEMIGEINRVYEKVKKEMESYIQGKDIRFTSMNTPSGSGGDFGDMTDKEFNEMMDDYDNDDDDDIIIMKICLSL